MDYEPCESAALEEGCEKVAIYASPEGIPTHAARQQADGTWTSKLGALDDITHNELSGLHSRVYGTVIKILKRSTQRT